MGANIVWWLLITSVQCKLLFLHLHLHLYVEPSNLTITQRVFQIHKNIAELPGVNTESYGKKLLRYEDTHI